MKQGPWDYGTRGCLQPSDLPGEGLPYLVHIHYPKRSSLPSNAQRWPCNLDYLQRLQSRALAHFLLAPRWKPSEYLCIFVSNPWPSKGGFDCGRGSLKCRALMLQDHPHTPLRMYTAGPTRACSPALEKRRSWAFG